jgi:alkaline phosphatase D
MIRHVLILLAALAPAMAGAQDAESTATLSRIAFGSCVNQGMRQPVWDAITNAQPELFLLIGDNIYSDTTNMALKQAAYAKLNAEPGYQRLRAACPVWATWDDHDFGFNDSGAEYPEKEASQRVFLEGFNEPTNSPRRQRAGVYDARVYGPPGRRIQVILLDTRYFRGPLKRRASRLPGEGWYEANQDKSSTMLGAEQWTWLRQQLRVPAELRLIVSSIQVVAEDHHWEKWMNLPHERQRLFNMISDTEADGIIFLSGDRHHAELSMMKGPLGYPLYDLTSSALNMSAEEPVVEINRRGISEVYDGNNFGLVTVDWSVPDPAITLEIRDEKGETRIQHGLKLSALQADPE